MDLSVSYARDVYDSSEFVFVNVADLPTRGYRGATFRAEPDIERHVQTTTAVQASYGFGSTKLDSVTSY